MLQARQEYEQSRQKQRIFAEFSYAAGTWDKQRRVIHKAEHNSRGDNPRFVVTSLAQALRSAGVTRVLAPGDPGYASETSGFDLGVTCLPDLFVAAQTPAEVAATVAFLLGPDGRAFTGAPVIMDQGWSAS